MKTALALLLAFASQIVFAAPASPYAGQETREIKALSAEDVDSYLTGKGMGLAKAAELNGYPGPAHVLQLAAELELTAEQKQRTQVVFERMEREAKTFGRELVDRERDLDRAFAAHKVTRESLDVQMRTIGELQGKVRGYGSGEAESDMHQHDHQHQH
jgi:hypothetical protein